MQASIDFEDDVGTTLLNGFQDEIKEVSKDLDGALLTATRGHLLAKGLQASLVAFFIMLILPPPSSGLCVALVFFW